MSNLHYRHAIDSASLTQLDHDKRIALEARRATYQAAPHPRDPSHIRTLRLTLRKVIVQRIFLRSDGASLAGAGLGARRIRLPYTHQFPELLEFGGADNAPAGFLVAARETLAEPLCEIRRVEGGNALERGNDVDGRVASTRTARDAAGEVDFAWEVAVVGHHDNLEVFGFEMRGLYRVQWFASL